MTALTIYSAPRTRALRVVWLLEEIGLPYELKTVEFKPTTDTFFIQDTPTGKIPVLEDGATLVSESGAILEYLLTKYAPDTLAPAAEDADFGRYLQWLHAAESTVWSPIGVMVWLTIYRTDAERHAALTADALARVKETLRHVNNDLQTASPYLLKSGFSAADIMLGFTLLAAHGLGLVADELTAMRRYLAALRERDAFKRAAQIVGGFG